jgi:hypothetical protein
MNLNDNATTGTEAMERVTNEWWVRPSPPSRSTDEAR